MANRRFNLVDESWAPIAEYDRAGLGAIFSNPKFPALGGTVLQKIALFKLLLAIAQAACTPETDEEWKKLGVEGMAEACRAYLEKWHDSFWLYGDKPFLQYPAVSRAKELDYGTIIPEVATGNATWLFHSQVPPASHDVDDAQRALALLVQMACCFGGKKPDSSVALTPGWVKKSSKPGPAICSLGLLHSFFVGGSLLQSIWFNLLTKEDIRQEKTYTEGIGTPPWEDMPSGENDARAQQLQRSLMGRLVPLARFILFEDVALRLVEGIQHPDYLTHGMVDPSVTANFSGKKPKMLWADPNRRPWRSLTAILGFLDHDKNGFVCRQIKWCAKRIRLSECSGFGIWVGGIRLSSNAGEQYLSGNDDVVESELNLPTGVFDGEESQWFDFLQKSMTTLESIAKILYRAVFFYYQDVQSDKKSEFANYATQLFWQRAEYEFSALNNACDDASEEGNAQRERIFSRIIGHAMSCYSQACPEDTARQLAVYVQHTPRFGKVLQKRV